MEKNTAGFWRGFTVKKFVTWTLINLGIGVLFELFALWLDKDTTARALLQTGNVVKIVANAVALAFLFALWTEPAKKNA